MQSVIIILTSLIITLILTAIFIPILHKLKFGQAIRDIGPSWHKSKSGTPTMGGIAIIIGFVLALVLTGAFVGMNAKFYAIIIVPIAYGLIGFVDDFIKIKFKRNLGLRAWQKFSLQLIAAIVPIVLLTEFGYLQKEIFIPFFNITADLGWFYVPFMIFIILAETNAVNLTDGIDGLVSSVTIIVCLFFAVVAQNVSMPEVYLPAFAIIGALIGFLVFNIHPAKIFMGDTGSLFLGSLIAMLAIVSGNPLILILVGIIYIIETLSVILQVAYFKATHGKRLFKMSPIHHHFEKCGWSEMKIVSVFSLITLVCCILGVLI